jgi:uncharacterized OsmC-like protein
MVQKHDSMQTAAAAKPAGADWHETVEATCVADDITGVRKLRMRDWTLIGDSGPSFGGYSLGPSSPELLCGVISTCLTHTYLIAAATLEVPVDRVEVKVTAENNDARFLGIDTDDPPVPYNLIARVSLEAPEASPEQQTALHAYAHERCPLTQLIRQANDLRIEVADPPPA